MNLHRLTSELSVSAQLAPTDANALKAAGFRSVICCRPDAEASDQALFHAIEQAARTAGLEARYCPVGFDKIRDDQALLFGRLLDKLPKPILAFCRSGAHTASGLRGRT